MCCVAVHNRRTGYFESPLHLPDGSGVELCAELKNEINDLRAHFKPSAGNRKTKTGRLREVSEAAASTKMGVTLGSPTPNRAPEQPGRSGDGADGRSMVVCRAGFDGPGFRD